MGIYWTEQQALTQAMKAARQKQVDYYVVRHPEDFDWTRFDIATDRELDTFYWGEQPRFWTNGEEVESCCY